MDRSNSHPLYANQPLEQPHNAISVVSLNQGSGSNIAGQQQINWSPLRNSLEQVQASSRPGSSSPCKVFLSTVIMKFMLNFSKSNCLLFPSSLNRTRRYRLHCNNKYLYKWKLCQILQNLWTGMRS